MDTSNGLLGELAQGFVELLWPTRCIGCDKTGVLLCSNCDRQLMRIDQEHACPRCGAPYGKIICTECNDSQGPCELSFSAAVAALEFEGTAVRLVKEYKDQHERRLSALLAGILYQVIPPEWLRWANVICYVPADNRAVNRRGFDHMRDVAIDLASLSGLPVLHLLSKCTDTDQRFLGRIARESNVNAAFVLRANAGNDSQNPRAAEAVPSSQAPCGLDVARSSQASRGLEAKRASSARVPSASSTRLSAKLPSRLPPRLPPRLLLIDDVLTTGATVEAATGALLEAGVDDIRVAVVARVW